MIDPRPVTKEMLPGVIEVRPDRRGLDFARAKDMADQVARKTLVDPILIAWFDRKAWKHSPAIC